MSERRSSADIMVAEEHDRLTYFQELCRGFQRAEGAAGDPIDRFYSFAGHTARFRFAGPALVPLLTPAIAHLETAPAPPLLTVWVWDSVSTDTRMPLLVSSLVSLLRLRWWEQLDIRREIKGYNSQRIRTTFHLGPDILSALDTQQHLAVYWVEDARQIPYYEKGYPFTSILSWWLEELGCQFVHAAAVGTPTGGVLLPGKGSSGKSTTTLACVEAGLYFLSDDYSLVVSDPSPSAHSVYNTAKLKGKEDIDRFPRVLPMIANRDRLGEEKALIFLQEHCPERIVRGFPIKAILVPKITGQSHTRLEAATPGTAFRAFAPSTIIQLSGAGQSAFRAMSSLVKRVPCYVLELGTRVSEIPEVIQRVLSDASRGDPEGARRGGE